MLRAAFRNRQVFYAGPSRAVGPKQLYLGNAAILGIRFASKKSRQKQDDDLEEEPRSKKEKRERVQKEQNLVPGSRQVLTGPGLVEYEKADAKMKAAVDWFRREVASAETRGSGRVTPDILKPVLVDIPGSAGPVRLMDIATVGVREGTMLLVTVFEDSNLRHVEKALYGAKIPHVVPQKLDNRTIKIPLPKPTVDARQEIAKEISKQAEDTRVQLRKLEQASVKKVDYEKHSVELKKFHDLLQKHIKDIDGLTADMKKKLGVR